MSQQLQAQQTSAEISVALLTNQSNHTQHAPTQNERPRVGMTSPKAFSTLSRSFGDVEDFDVWRFKIRQFW